ncbi:MAG TPA: glycosyltransferase [Polyangia bacterium]|nr:glycosyltransferase [Polyangia bacterium]
MARTKIFYFIPNLQQGGPEGQILALINRLPARFEPVLCVYHADDIFFDARCPPGQPAHALGVRRMGLEALDRLTEILRREKPAIVHSYRDKSNFWARLAAARAGVPITITACRNRMMELRYLLIERFMSRFSRLILTNSEGVRYELTEWAGVPDDKIRVITNILDVEQFRPPTAGERAAARARWELGPSTRALLLPGRVGLQKHQIGVLLAMRRLLRRGLWPADTVVLFAGRERDRATSWLVRRLAAPRKVAARVRFLGAVKDIRSLYWASDLLVMPSLYEGLANAALEGAACGLPALLSHAANVDGIVQPGVTGWEIPTGNQAALMAALADAVATPADTLAEMGRRGRTRVVERFAPTDSFVIDQMVAVYDQLLAEKALA